MMNSQRERNSGYALLDVVIAVALFSITVTGLVQVMQKINSTSGEFARDRMIQQHIEAMLYEKRRLPVAEIAAETYDELLDITFRSYAEPFQIDNGEGSELADLYQLTVEAAYTNEGGAQLEKAQLIIYQPE
jgi:Tfp pilus assembly protein PilV